MIKSLIWNARDVTGRVTSRRLKKLLRLNSVSFLVILEPMLEASAFLGFVEKFGFHLGLCNDSSKIWVCWKNQFAVNVIENTDQLLHLAFAHESLFETLYCTFVYAKCTRNERQDLWVSLSNIHQSVG